MKSSKTSFLRNCISGWNVRTKKERYPIHTIRYYFGIFAGKYNESLGGFRHII